jgi:hypothetical protein
MITEYEKILIELALKNKIEREEDFIKVMEKGIISENTKSIIKSSKEIIEEHNNIIEKVKEL